MEVSDEEIKNLFILYYLCKDMFDGDLDRLNFYLQYMYYMKHGEQMPIKMIEVLHAIMTKDMELEASKAQVQT